MSLQEILSNGGSRMPVDEFLRKLWEGHSDEGALRGGLAKAIRTITGLSDHFAKKVQDFLEENEFASRSKKGAGSAPGWMLNPAKFVKPEPQEEVSVEESSPSLSERLAAEQEARQRELERIANEMSDLEAARGIVDTYGDPDRPEKLRRILDVIERML